MKVAFSSSSMLIAIRKCTVRMRMSSDPNVCSTNTSTNSHPGPSNPLEMDKEHVLAETSLSKKQT